jgi:hypothetical protein
MTADEQTNLHEPLIYSSQTLQPSRFVGIAFATANGNSLAMAKEIEHLVPTKVGARNFCRGGRR